MRVSDFQREVIGAELAQISEKQRQHAAVWSDAKASDADMMMPAFLRLLWEPAIYAGTVVGVLMPEIMREDSWLAVPAMVTTNVYGVARSDGWAGGELQIDRNSHGLSQRMRVAPISMLKGPGPKSLAALPVGAGGGIPVGRRYSGRELRESLRRECNRTGSPCFPVHPELPWIYMRDNDERLRLQGRESVAGPRPRDELVCRTCPSSFPYDPRTIREAEEILEEFVAAHMHNAPAIRAGEMVGIGPDGRARAFRGAQLTSLYVDEARRWREAVDEAPFMCEVDDE